MADVPVSTEIVRYRKKLLEESGKERVCIICDILEAQGKQPAIAYDEHQVDALAFAFDPSLSILKQTYQGQVLAEIELIDEQGKTLSPEPMQVVIKRTPAVHRDVDSISASRSLLEQLEKSSHSPRVRIIDVFVEPSQVNLDEL